MGQRTRYIAFAWLVALCVQGNAGEAALEPYPLEYWALRDVIDNARISPDGKHLGLMKIPSRDGNPIIEIYDAANLDKKPFRLNANPMEITGFSWVSDTHILFFARQKVRDKIEGFNQGVYEFKLGMLDVKRKKVSEFSETRRATIENVLPSAPNKVIVSVVSGSGDGPGSKLKEGFRPRAYYELDLRKGTRKLLIRGTPAFGGYAFDGDGNEWLTQGFDFRTKEYVWSHRKLGSKKWREIYRQHEDDFDFFGVVGFDVDDRNKLYVIANNGHDKAGLWLLDADTGDMELQYRRPDVDLWNGVIGHSNNWAHPDQIVGLMYGKDKFHFEFFDEVEGATHAQLMELIPHAHTLQIRSRSRDGNTLTITNSGPRDPGTSYLLKNGRLQVVGSSQPLLESENLADVKYITYKARDGRTIPAYLTVPHGKPPFPLVVMPHGGPFVREVQTYDKWAQLLANNGYLVLQPQYRGSRNHGLEFYLSAFKDGGQGGYRMQDDKDDGALYLVKQGLADRDRMALFGWSYGGYAALIAASRTPQIYRCVIAGAAVSDPLMQVNYYRFSPRMRGAPREEQLRMWDDSISPIKEAAKVNVPMLIVHGDVDQRVPPAHARKYLKQLDKYGKPYQYLELKGADHFSNTLFYHHQLEFFEAMINFLDDQLGGEQS